MTGLSLLMIGAAVTTIGNAYWEWHSQTQKQKIFNQYVDSTVCVYSIYSAKDTVIYGTGVIIDNKGTILTFGGCVLLADRKEQPESIWVKFHGETKEYKADFVDYIWELDSAFIRLQNDGKDCRHHFKAADLRSPLIAYTKNASDEKKRQVSTWCPSLGSTVYMLESTSPWEKFFDKANIGIQKGYLLSCESYDGYVIDEESEFSVRTFKGILIKTWLKTSGFFSGGPLIDSKGRFIGIAVRQATSDFNFKIAFGVHILSFLILDNEQQNKMNALLND